MNSRSTSVVVPRVAREREPAGRCRGTPHDDTYRTSGAPIVPSAAAPGLTTGPLPRCTDAVPDQRSSAAAVVLAGGSGTRVGGDGNKVFLPVAGRTMISFSLETFSATWRALVSRVLASEGQPELVSSARLAAETR